MTGFEFERWAWPTYFKKELYKDDKPFHTLRNYKFSMWNTGLFYNACQEDPSDFSSMCIKKMLMMQTCLQHM